jgi:hypothetical protein
MKYGKNVTTYVTLFKNVEINIIKNDVQIRAKISDESKNAVLRMMREKLVKSKKLMANTRKDLYQPITSSINKSGSESIVPYLLRERIIKV